MVADKRITHASGREVLQALVDPGSPMADPEQVVERRNLAAVSDAGELEAIVERAIEAEPGAAEKVKDGNAKAIGPIVGAVMRETNGKADGGEVTRLIREKLGAS
jgi:aspartyl-tRNA(Asn)/glutamyl-tRNA(Gln) amidotransferase subunit B